MGYALGIDVGTTFTAAAVQRDGTVEMLPLTTYQVAVPSVIFVAGDEVLFAGAAERRGAAEPSGLAREFKRRLGDTVPLVLSGSPYHADRLTAMMAKWVVDTATTHFGEPPEQAVMTHPANWTEYQLGVLRNALQDIGLSGVELLSEPAAAALDYSAAASLPAGANVLVYDLGGGTFDVALLRREGDAFEHRVEPSGIERLGGIDFDEAVFQYVVTKVPPDAIAGARSSPEGLGALAQLRRSCVDAKEALSPDTAADVPVMLPGYTGSVRITRAEFEEMIRPMVRQTIDVVGRVIGRADLEPSDLAAVLLVGGSSRIPLVPQLVSEELGVPVRVDAHPKLVVARGAARRAATARPVRAAPARPAGGSGGRPRRRTPLVVGAGVAAVAALAVAGVLVVGGGDEDGAGSDATTPASAPPTDRPADSVTSAPPTAAPSTPTSASPSSAPATAGSTPPTTPDDAPEPGEVVWTVPTGAAMASVRGPALAEGSVVFGSQDGMVRRVAAEDGTIVWEQPVSELVFSSPTVSGDTVYVGGSDGVYALSFDDGTVRWTAAQGASAQSSPLVVDGTVYIGSDDANVYALDAATGTVRWQTALGGPVLSSPAVGGGRVFVGSFDGSFYALDAATGEVAWSAPLGGQVWSSPAVDEATVYVGGPDRALHAFDLATGEERWRFLTSDVVSSSPAVQDGVVYVGSFDGRVYAVDATTGGERWRFDTGNVVFSSPRPAGDTVYIGSHARYVYALDAEAGEPIWRYRAGGIVGATPSVDDARVYVGSDDGNLYALSR